MEYLKISKEKSLPKMKARGPTPCSGGGGRAPTSWAPWWLSDAHLLLYEVVRQEKNQKQPFGTRLRRHKAEPWRNLGGTNLGLRQSCSAGDTSLREAEIIDIIITNAPLIRRGQSP